MQRILSAFELLGVAPDSDDATIRKAWRALVRTYHPDMAKSDPQGANRRLAEINAAFDVVSACTAGERQRLRRLMAEKRRAEEARRREMAARQARAQAAYEAARAFRTAESRKDRADAGAPKAEKPAARAVVRRAPEATASTAAPAVAAAGEPDSALRLAELARQAFVTARRVCAGGERATMEPLYV